jgi:hypothetical protein
MKTWLNDELKKDVRKVFEPRYKRKLLDEEVVDIANNLTGFLEVYVKSKYYGKVTK